MKDSDLQKVLTQSLDQSSQTEDLSLKKTLLKKQECFSSLTPIELETLASIIEEKKYDKDQIIVREGDPVDGFYLIVQGRVLVQVMDLKTGKCETVATLTAENFDAIGLNESGFYSLSGLRTASVTAMENIKVFFVALPLFNGFALTYPHVNQVMRATAKKFVNS